MRLVDFAHMASQMLRVSLRAWRVTTQVMLGVSLQARWDTGQVRHNSSSYNDISILSMNLNGYVLRCLLLYKTQITSKPCEMGMEYKKILWKYTSTLSAIRNSNSDKYQYFKIIHK